MDKNEKIMNVRILCGRDKITEDEIGLYLSLAESAILQEMHPNPKVDISTKVMPSRYDMLQCKLAHRYICRRGSEGEISQSENGITRRYDSVDDRDLLNNVIQVIEI